jgi:hypothetical protein
VLEEVGARRRVQQAQGIFSAAGLLGICGDIADVAPEVAIRLLLNPALQIAFDGRELVQVFDTEASDHREEGVEFLCLFESLRSLLCRGRGVFRFF